MAQLDRMKLEPWHWWLVVFLLGGGLALALTQGGEQPGHRPAPESAAGVAPRTQPDMAPVPSEPSLFWCRKMDNRECSPSRERCEKGLSGQGAECFSRPTAWCFQAGFGLAEVEGDPRQVICVAHREYCEEWRSERRGKKDKRCLELTPREYPTE